MNLLLNRKDLVTSVPVDSTTMNQDFLKFVKKQAGFEIPCSSTQ
jgi:hypothetical protein